MNYIALALAALIAGPAAAQEYGFAGILSSGNRGDDLPALTLSAGQPVSEQPIMLKSGKVYELEIEADGSQELALEGAAFFRNIWVNEVVINGIEVRPYGISSVEFDEAGEMEIEFVAIRPGTYTLAIPGTTADAQRVSITIE